MWQRGAGCAQTLATTSLALWASVSASVEWGSVTHSSSQGRRKDDRR